MILQILKYKIKSGDYYIYKFTNTQQGRIQFSTEGKIFTKASLDKFIQKYSGAGYGFDINDCVIEEVK